MNTKLFVVEILDTVSAYLSPVQYGISKNDLIDFYNSVKNYSNSEFIEFLRYKKIIATSDDFVNLLLMYSKDNFLIKCFEVSIDFSLFENKLLFDEELAFAIKDMCLKKKPYSLGKKIVSKYYDYVVEQ